ncbi:hypothetical protein GCM10020227_50140 [Streptomyces flavovirens]
MALGALPLAAVPGDGHTWILALLDIGPSLYPAWPAHRAAPGIERHATNLASTGTRRA